MNTKPQDYLSYVYGLGHRYDWLAKYLEHDHGFVKTHIHPIRIDGSINVFNRVAIVDFFKDDRFPPQLRNHFDFYNTQELSSWLNRDQLGGRVHGRLILVSSTSGVEASELKSRFNNSDEKCHSNAPVLTSPRIAGQIAAHPIRHHTPRLPNPKILCCVADVVGPDAEFLLRFLDQTKHLTNQSHTTTCLEREHVIVSPNSWKYLHIGLDQANIVAVAFQQEIADAPWTMLMLTTEDNCLGIDMNEETPPHSQPLLASRLSPSQKFLENLAAMSRTQYGAISKQPLKLVPLYCNSLVSAFAAHVELCQRNWSTVYEPYANTSVVYGYSYHRDAVRQLARRYNSHLRYMKHTIDSLQRFLASTSDSPDYGKVLDSLRRDFEQFVEEIGILKLLCDQFLEQQVSKLALQDARTQMREARDLKRISYLAFIFVPLSLTSTFFGMNTKELDSGPTPVWVFIVTALAILFGSLSIIWLSRSPLSDMRNLIATIIHNLGRGQVQPAKPAESQLPPSDPYNVVSKPKQRWKWIFRRNSKPDPTYILTASDMVSVPPTNPYIQPLYQPSAPPPPFHGNTLQPYSAPSPLAQQFQPSQQFSAASAQWTPVPATYEDPYEPLAHDSSSRNQAVMFDDMPQPPPLYPDPITMPYPGNPYHP